MNELLPPLTANYPFLSDKQKQKVMEIKLAMRQISAQMGVDKARHLSILQLQQQFYEHSKKLKYFWNLNYKRSLEAQS